MSKRKVYKIAVSSKKNLVMLKEQGIWALPSGKSPQYQTFINKVNPGDALIFTVKGLPVATGVVQTRPNKNSLSGSWPNGKRYGFTFSVKLNSFGSMSKELRDKRDIEFKRGVITESDIHTYYKCRGELTPVNWVNPVLYS